MNLLEEILDSLNTTTLEQGKLSAAKSLDFFRSMDDLDYKAPVSKPEGAILKQKKSYHYLNIGSRVQRRFEHPTLSRNMKALCC